MFIITKDYATKILKYKCIFCIDEVHGISEIIIKRKLKDNKTCIQIYSCFNPRLCSLLQRMNFFFVNEIHDVIAAITKYK